MSQFGESDMATRLKRRLTDTQIKKARADPKGDSFLM